MILLRNDNKFSTDIIEKVKYDYISSRSGELINDHEALEENMKAIHAMCDCFRPEE